MADAKLGEMTVNEMMLIAKDERQLLRQALQAAINTQHAGAIKKILARIEFLQGLLAHAHNIQVEGDE